VSSETHPSRSASVRAGASIRADHAVDPEERRPPELEVYIGGAAVDGLA
jgi:hypothetical protein